MNRRPGPVGQVVALLKDGTLVTFDLKPSSQPKQRRIGKRSVRGSGRRLAWNAGASRMYAIVATERRESELVILERTSWQIVRRIHVGDGGRFRSVAPGPRTGHLYLFGNRRGDPVVRIMAEDGELIREWRVRRATRPHWDTIDGEVSADERDAFLSYHGGVEGVDRFDLSAGRLVCARPNPNGGCLAPRAHGFVAWQAGRLIATTAGEALLRIAVAERRIERMHTGLRDNHMVSFAVVPGSGAIYAAGSCLYAGGYSEISPEGELVRTPVESDYPTPIASGRPCGERLALGGSPLTGALAQTRDYDDDARGAVAIIDPATGRVRRTVDMPAIPEDVLVTPPD